MSTLIYLAYGSNLHPLRLRERVPSAQAAGVVRLPGYALYFHKRSEDRSGKCDLVSCASGSEAFGALYQIDAAEKHLLDRVEGVGNGYELVDMPCDLAGSEVNAFAYAATPSHIEPDLSPYHWYKELVIAGARYHRLPASYLARIDAVVAAADPDLTRSRDHSDLLQRIALYDQQR